MLGRKFAWRLLRPAGLLSRLALDGASRFFLRAWFSFFGRQVFVSGMSRHALLAACFALSCGSSSEPGADAGAEASGLPVVNEFDPELAAQGRAFLEESWPGAPILPTLALENLWLVWGTGPVDEATRWQEFEARYGLFREGDAAYPVGLAPVAGGDLTFNCLLCHASRSAEPGQSFVGVGNAHLDLERLYDDLLALADLAEGAGLGPFPVPYDLAGASGAPGAVDGIGLGMRFAGTIDDLGETFGYQQAPAWWTMRYRERLYSDGSGRVDNWRTMMSTLFSFGMSQGEIQSYDEDFQALRHYLLGLDAPPWPYDWPGAAEVMEGQDVFDSKCASCHGVYHGPDAHFPDMVVGGSAIATDPIRTDGMDATQVGIINESWYGAPAAWSTTDGYLAPALTGVWASAPYFHNGSVPDLVGVLDSGERPAIWRYADARSYDPARAGWAFETSGPPESLYDTSERSLGNGGHSYGDLLSAGERSALLAYLKTL